MDRLELIKRTLEDAIVQKTERGQRLVLRRRRHALVGGKPGQERRNIRLIQVLGMATIVGVDIPANPMDIGCFRSPAVSLFARRAPNQLHEPEATGRVRRVVQMRRRNARQHTRNVGWKRRGRRIDSPPAPSKHHPVAAGAGLALRIEDVADPMLHPHEVQLRFAIAGLRDRRAHLLSKRHQLTTQLRLRVFR